MAEALRERLDVGLARLGGPAAALDETARERLVRFVRLLEKWNRVHNLTAVRDAHEMIGRHVLDSLALLPWLPTPGRVAANGSRAAGVGAGRGAGQARGNDRNGIVNGESGGDPDGGLGSDPVDRSGGGSDADLGRHLSGGPNDGSGSGSGIGPGGGLAVTSVDLLDIGSGGGLPGLVLAIARPALHCLSIDAVGKKVRFQSQAVLELGLAGVTARHARIEDVRVRTRTAVSRAFAAPADFLRAAAPHCGPGSTALVMLGRRERLPEALPAPFVLREVHAVDIPFGSGARHVAVCRAH